MIYLALDVIKMQVSLQKCEKTPLKVAEPKITASSYLHQTTVIHPLRRPLSEFALGVFRFTYGI